MNRDLIEQFVVLQKYFRDQGDKGRSIAYARAIAALRTVDTDITSIQEIRGVRGIGPKVIAKVQEYLNTGKISTVEEKKKELKKEKLLTVKEAVLADFQTIHGVGPKIASKLYDSGIHSIDDLRQHPELLTNAQKIGLKYRKDLQKKISRNLITSMFVILTCYLNKKFGRKSYKMEIAGSYRRGSTESGDIDCLITSRVFTLLDVVTLLKDKNVITDVLGMRNEKMLGIAQCPGEPNIHFRLDIEFVPEEEWGSSLLYFTGSQGFNVYMRADAKRKGMLLNEHGLFSIETGEKILENPSEEDIFTEIGMKFVPPNRR